MENLYNWNIVGHERVIAELTKNIVGGNVAHAYLFAGPEAVGKFTVATTMANILQCENNFCGECSTCREIKKGLHSDTIEICDDGESIKIETIRNTLTSLYMSKNSPYKILLIQNVERMTLESANAMLKTLEDPPERVVFILTTSRPKEILPTIISRVRVCTFQRLSENQVREFVQKLDPLADGDLVERVGSFAMGMTGKAALFMQNPALFEEARKMYNDVVLFVENPDRANEFGYVAQVLQQAKDDENDKIIGDFLDIFTAVLRDKLLKDENGAMGNPGRKKTINLIKEAVKAQDLLKRNVNNKLLLENLMLGLC
jgi:DNA polymerase III subunit delta'